MKIIEDIIRYLNQNESIYIVGSWRDEIFKSISIIQEQIELFDKGENTDNEEINVIIECIEFINNIVIDLKLDEASKQFVRDYIYLVYNWNDNIKKSKSLGKEIGFIQRLIDNELRFEENLQVIQMVSQRLDNLKHQLPPSFELSKHYLEILKEEQ